MKYLFWMFSFVCLGGCQQARKIAPPTYFSVLTNDSQKLWFMFNQGTLIPKGWLLRADSTYSYFELDEKDSVKIIKWVDPDISYGDGILKWRLANDTLLLQLDVPQKIIGINKDTLLISDDKNKWQPVRKFVGRKFEK